MPQLFVHASGEAALPADFRESSPTKFKSGQGESLRSVLCGPEEENLSSLLFTNIHGNYQGAIPQNAKEKDNQKTNRTDFSMPNSHGYAWNGLYSRVNHAIQSSWDHAFAFLVLFF